MAETLHPYPAMKDSGVAWLGEVPEHWDVRRLSASATACVNGVWGSEPDGRNDLPCVRVADFDRFGHRVRTPVPTRRAIKPRDRQRRMLQAGDLLLEKSGGGDLQPVGVVVLYDHPEQAVCSNFIARMPAAHGYLPRFLTYLHSNLYAIGLNIRSIKQTTGIQNLDSRSYLSEPVAFPPPDEQVAIVRFLDHADRKIRRAIRAKQKLVKLLEEEKQAIIHRAVTRGLDPNVRLKPSGVEWLGAVPEHWAAVRLKDVASVQTGITLGKDYRALQTRRYPYLRVANVQSGRLDLRVVKHIDVPDSEARGTTLRAGDVLMTEGGDIDKLGRGCVWTGEISPCLHQNHVFAVRCGPALLPEFLVAAMSSQHGRAYFEITAKQTTNLAATNSTTLRALPLFLPSTTEQEQILTGVAEETRLRNREAERAEREVALLREYRTRLIADVVTGKLDVRDAAARLPDELPEPEAEDDSDAEGDEAIESEDDADAGAEDKAA